MEMCVRYRYVRGICIFGNSISMLNPNLPRSHEYIIYDRNLIHTDVVKKVFMTAL